MTKRSEDEQRQDLKRTMDARNQDCRRSGVPGEDCVTIFRPEGWCDNCAAREAYKHLRRTEDELRETRESLEASRAEVERLGRHLSDSEAKIAVGEEIMEGAEARAVAERGERDEWRRLHDEKADQLRRALNESSVIRAKLVEIALLVNNEWDSSASVEQLAAEIRDGIDRRRKADGEEIGALKEQLRYTQNLLDEERVRADDYFQALSKAVPGPNQQELREAFKVIAEAAGINLESTDSATDAAEMIAEKFRSLVSKLKVANRSLDTISRMARRPEQRWVPLVASDVSIG